MNVKNQHENHPDAEMLGAFAEQALGGRERGEVLEHLAACGRCRQVVALAREAAGAEVAARRHAPARPRVWFRSWGLALAPVAAVAAFGLATFIKWRFVRKIKQRLSFAPRPLSRQRVRILKNLAAGRFIR